MDDKIGRENYHHGRHISVAIADILKSNYYPLATIKYYEI